MGTSAGKEFDNEVRKIALATNGVKGINDLRSLYVGDKFHIEIHVEVDGNLTTQESHDIGNEVRFALEKIDEVHKVFVHVDPV
ncbi:MAG: hypothetical protein A3J88_06580 [Melioribacter sp. RIFOXYB12_FULL_38_5]|nr:MAG: hypothetical protein A3J88_06580 [Melioribacter sp. RIFOXYB12_FULL_38_5]